MWNIIRFCFGNQKKIMACQIWLFTFLMDSFPLLIFHFLFLSNKKAAEISQKVFIPFFDIHVHDLFFTFHLNYLKPVIIVFFLVFMVLPFSQNQGWATPGNVLLSPFRRLIERINILQVAICEVFSDALGLCFSGSSAVSWARDNQVRDAVNR